MTAPGSAPAAAAPPRVIVATSAGFVAGERAPVAVGPVLRHAVELSGAARPRVCVVNTAGGDDPRWQGWCYAALADAGWSPTHLSLFTMPNVDDITGHLLGCDVVWVGGGSVANLLALWRLHGVDAAMHAAWTAGVVLGGVSAGSLCWHVGGTTDSYGPQLRAVTDGLGFLPYSNTPHYDSEAARRPLYQQLVRDAVLPDGWATDDGVGLVFTGTELTDVVADRPGAAAWQVRAAPGQQAGGQVGNAASAERAVTEQRLSPRVLPH